MGRVDFANNLRGLAALCVVVGHYLGVFWLNRPAVANLLGAPTLPGSIATPEIVPYLWSVRDFGWGPFGVALFFLISGFVIPFSFQRTGAGGFLIGRIFRICPTYFVGFSITLLALAATRLYFHNDSWPYSASHIAAHYFPGVRDILQFESIDGIIWTLEVEVRFYIVCALLSVWLSRLDRRVFVVAIFIGLVAIALPTLYGANYYALMARNALAFITFMFIGVAIHYNFKGRLSGEGLAILGPVLFAVFVVAMASGASTRGVSLLWNYALAAIIFLTAAVFARNWRSNPVLEFFADISYPLYVSHGLFGYALMRVALDSGLPSGVAVLLAIVGAIVLAWAMHIAVEEPTHRLGKKLAKGFALYIAIPSKKVSRVAPDITLSPAPARNTHASK